MELLERYLQAVRFFLPRHQQDDIVRELSENLVSEMEDRKEACGRPLTPDEEADILRRHGHPMLVAGRYQTRQQLIGPAFFPIYVVALKMGLAVALLVTAVLAIVGSMLTGDPIRHFVQALLAYPGRALMVFAWTTLSFGGLDYAQSHLKLGHTWDPRTLPKLVRREHWTSRGHSLFEFLITVAFIVWLLLIPGAPHLLLGPAASFLELAPVWRLAYVPILLLMASAAAAEPHRGPPAVLDSCAVVRAHRAARRHSRDRGHRAPRRRVGAREARCGSDRRRFAGPAR